MHPLYPVIKPYKCHELAVSEPHVLYLEEVGNPKGIPVLILHGGPGAGGDTNLRRFFDPQVYRMVLFDQRGCGRSTPHASPLNNNTTNLLDDVDAIRDYLGLSHFVLFGGGWGALLALLYAQLYPQQILALVLHQIFLGRKKEVNWFYQSGANLVYPDYWQEFISPVPKEKQHQITDYYAQCLHGNNHLIRRSAAKNWALWQARCSTIQPHLALIEQTCDPHFSLQLALLETHYIKHDYFIAENQILANAHKIRHLLTYLVHGRYDMICPLETAWELHQALATSSLRIVRDAGHSEQEASMIDAIIDITKELSNQHLDAC